MKKIKLTQGKFALVDDEDFDFINQWKWCAKKDTRNFYAFRTDYENGKKSILMHRVVLNINNPKIKIDHRDIDGLNNQKINLRIVSDSESSRNKRGVQNTSSVYKGVYRLNVNRKNKWRAMIGIDGKQIHLGCFPTQELAAIAYNDSAKKLHGEFANLNPV